MKGKLITLEGISGIGKTYFSNQLRYVFNENDVLFHKEIMDEKHKGINRQIFNILCSTGSKFFDTGNPKMETFLIAAKQANDEENAIIPAMRAGKTVISDRGLDSICIYQGILFAKKYGKSPLDYTLKLYEKLKGLCLTPDKTILFTGDISKAIARAETRDSDRYTAEELQILAQASNLYLEIAKCNTDRFCVVNVDELTNKQVINKIIKEVDRINCRSYIEDKDERKL